MGLGRGWACDGIQLNCSKTRPSGAAWGPVGEGLGMHWDAKTLLEERSLGYKDRPSGAAWGRFGPSGA